MGLILDSTAAVAAERQGKNARQLLESVALEAGDDEIAVSVVTLLELAHGITRDDRIERRERRQRFLDELLIGVPIQPVTVKVLMPAKVTLVGDGGRVTIEVFDYERTNTDNEDDANWLSSTITVDVCLLYGVCSKLLSRHTRWSCSVRG